MSPAVARFETGTNPRLLPVPASGYGGPVSSSGLTTIPPILPAQYLLNIQTIIFFILQIKQQKRIEITNFKLNYRAIWNSGRLESIWTRKPPPGHGADLSNPDMGI